MLESTYQGGDWYRGNLHAHTTESDGERDPQVVVDDYADRGYDFLMISDHDKLTDPSKLDPRGMILIPGNEVTARGPHLLHVNAARRVEPLKDRQAVLDDIASNAKSLAVMAHPNWHRDFNHLPQEMLESLSNYAGIELYNGVIERLHGSPYATDRWDQLLGQGHRVWGFANDDSHAAVDVELGWNVVQTEDRSVDGIVEALRCGSFYASTGITFDYIGLEENTIIIHAAEEVRFNIYREFQIRVASNVGQRLTFEAPSDLKYQYLRVEAHGPLGRAAWTQPFFNS